MPAVIRNLRDPIVQAIAGMVAVIVIVIYLLSQASAAVASTVYVGVKFYVDGTAIVWSSHPLLLNGTKDTVFVLKATPADIKDVEDMLSHAEVEGRDGSLLPVTCVYPATTTQLQFAGTPDIVFKLCVPEK